MTQGILFHTVGFERVYAFVPEYCISPQGSLVQNLYIDHGWASLNNSLQAIPRGSHVIPDTKRPITGADAEQFWNVFLDACSKSGRFVKLKE